MKILVTGATGFLGRAVAAALQSDGHGLVLPLRQKDLPQAFHRAQVEVHPISGIENLDVADWQRLLQNVDAVVHTAAIAHIGDDIPAARYQAVNCAASTKLAEAAQAVGVKSFVFISSIRAQVGPSSDVIQNEDITPQPTEAYGRSKLQAEQAIFKAFSAATILRPALILGDNPKGNLASIVRLARLPVPLPFGSLNRPQAMVCLINVVSAIRLALSNPAMQSETFVLADSEHPSIARIFEVLRSGMGRKALLLPLPKTLFSLALALVGKSKDQDRILGGLRVDSSKLRRFGWMQVEKPEDVLRRIGDKIMAIR